MKTEEIESEIDYLLIAEICRLVSKGLSYPDKKLIDEITLISKDLITGTTQDKTLNNLLIKLQEELNEDEIRNEYSRIFLSGGLPVSESYCTGRFDCVSDVSGFYQAFGLNAKSGDVPDSISYELEFLALLAVKIVLAPNDETMEITSTAFQKFYSQHLSDFIEKFDEKLMKFNPSLYYNLLMDILKYSSKYHLKNK